MRDTDWKQLNQAAGKYQRERAGGAAIPSESLAEAGQVAGWDQDPPGKVLSPSPGASEHNQKRNFGTKNVELTGPGGELRAMTQGWAREGGWRDPKITINYTCDRTKGVSPAEELGNQVVVEVCFVPAV